MGIVRGVCLWRNHFFMKHKNIFQKVRKLIDEREIGEANLSEAQEELHALIEEDPECDWAYGLLSEICYWSGEYSEGADKLDFFDEGVKFGEQGIEINENSLEANFWLSVNYGLYGQEKGIMQSLALITPIKTAAERVLLIDESFFYGGPWRVLGRLYQKAPGFPFSVGSTKKAVECLEKALQFGPRFFLNRFFLADAYIANRDKANAQKHLEWILNTPPNKNHEWEDEGYKRDAEALLEKL